MRRVFRLIVSVLCLSMLTTLLACSSDDTSLEGTTETNDTSATEKDDVDAGDVMVKLQNGLYYCEYNGDDYFDEFLKSSIKSDEEAIRFVTSRLGGEYSSNLSKNVYGCSTIYQDGIFGRNFDWGKTSAAIVVNRPTNGFKSISTVSIDLIGMNENTFRPLMGVYAPLDGMNEKGLCIAVNMISDSRTYNGGDGADVTTTTLIRYILNTCSTTKEAIELIRGVRLHMSMGLMIHYQICDSSGDSRVVEFVNDEVSVVESDILTNFYLTESLYEVGSSDSKVRFNILKDRIASEDSFDMDKISDVLYSVRKSQYSSYLLSNWSAVYDMKNLKYRLYYSEDFTSYYEYGI